MSILFAPVALGHLTWDWSRTCVFGVVNITPDSFSDGGLFFDPARAVAHGVSLAGQGADVLDIGGESTRPGAQPVSSQEELDRVLPVISELASRCACPISIDTYKAEVARRAVAAGASIINDVSGMTLDPAMPAAVAETGATVVLGHLRGQPATMQQGVHFDDVVAEVTDELRAAVRRAVEAGIGPDRIWIDPGLGFGKLPHHSLALIKRCGRVRDEVGYPLLIGPSRKGFIGQVTGEPVEDRLFGTCGAVVAAIQAGADGVRIHDVSELASAVRLADAIRRTEG